uniref:GFO/IDH/MocA-like oxidoreductase domain-containing protein n=1 Tax=Ciona savignyi TaxID=51511 RepID=H2ZA52_CIOSA
MIRWIVGEDPVTLYTTAHVSDPDIKALDDVDTVYIVMKFPSGVLAHIDISRYCSYGYDQTVQIYGDSGNLISANPLKTGLIKNGGLERDEIFFSFDSRYADAYKEELAHFVNLIKGKTSTCCIKPCDTLKATMLCCAAEESHRTGKHIVVANYFKEAFGAYIDDPIMNE